MVGRWMVEFEPSIIFVNRASIRLEVNVENHRLSQSWEFLWRPGGGLENSEGYFFGDTWHITLRLGNLLLGIWHSFKKTCSVLSSGHGDLKMCLTISGNYSIYRITSRDGWNQYPKQIITQKRVRKKGGNTHREPLLYLNAYNLAEVSIMAPSYSSFKYSARE